jgi:hypothetical protein
LKTVWGFKISAVLNKYIIVHKNFVLITWVAL